MYCFNCGKTFHANEIVRKFDWDTGPSYCCPFCGVDDIAETQECSICGEDFLEGEIYSGFCLGCLWEAIDYDVALAYMKGHENWLAEFLLGDWFGASFDDRIGSTPDLDAFLEETFQRLVADEKLRCAMCKLEEARFLEACRLFCLPFYPNGDFGAEGEQFAEWYAKRKKEAKNEKSEHRNS